ncbi:ribosomal protein S18-alanine N-acetyltransferase [Candidatus Bathyarchaeota archaeon]|nr:ribosomal protein S18-alanine N-acetyltransferase [Candidatus Bathyarchaeota archaeon]
MLKFVNICDRNMRNIEIKQASTADLQILYKIERECFSSEAFSMEELSFLIKNPNSISLIAKIDKEIAGFIIGLIYDTKSGKIGHILTLDVAKKYRRKGVARKLMEKLEGKFREKTVKECFLEVRIDNEAAKRLYRKLGYTEIACLKDYYGNGVHGIRLKKVLA